MPFFRIKPLAISIFLVSSGVLLLSNINHVHAEDVQFNFDVLDIKDRSNIDLTNFSRKGYVMPGAYTLAVKVNEQLISEESLNFYSPDDDPQGSQACLTPAIVDKFGLKPAVMSELQWQRSGECLDPAALDGLETRADLATSTLWVNLPQAYLEYSHEGWDPPARWDNGIAGLLFDYSLSAQHQQQKGNRSGNTNSVSGYGTAGVNFGPWRLRGDWQGRYEPGAMQGSSAQQWDLNRLYAYRALGDMGAKVTLGEDYLNSAMFDSFRFTGASLVSDDQMLPPNLRGYAPEVVGVARGNAKVVISQQGRVLQETQVAAGPFRIQDLSSAVAGTLDVRVEEQDGSVQTFQVDTATIPYLTRPGLVRYKASVGKPSTQDHQISNTLFATGEFSWGVSNGWSIYGGALGEENYQALSLGVGRDLMMFGALSADVTQSSARFDQGESMRGRSYRLSYSKRFAELKSQVTFAGYRFSEKEYLGVNDYLAIQEQKRWSRMGRSKELYTITYNQRIEPLNLYAYLNYNHQTYWDRPTSDYYTLTLARSFDAASFKNISLSLTGYRNENYGRRDDGMYMTLSLPWGTSGRVGYNGSWNKNDHRNSVNYSDKINDDSSYQLGAGSSGSGSELNGFYSLNGSTSHVSASASHRAGQYNSLGLNFRGGATITAEGGALHSSTVAGGTRMLIDTSGVSGVPVSGYGRSVKSNMFGKAVVGDINSYNRSSVQVDVNKLDDNMEVLRSVTEATLTEGAIGYRKLEVVSGAKAMAVIRLASGEAPPFGATVSNLKGQETGIVSDSGEVYLSGIQSGQKMNVRWNGKVQCEIELPQLSGNSMSENLLLPCVAVTQSQPDNV
jgi:outer membrane usher protein PapC